MERILQMSPEMRGFSRVYAQFEIESAALLASGSTPTRNRIAVVGGAVPTGGLLELVARERRVIVRGIPPLGNDSIPRPFERVEEQRGRASKGHELNLRGENRLEEIRQSDRSDFARQPVGVEDHDRGPVYPCRRRRKVREFSYLHSQ